MKKILLLSACLLAIANSSAIAQTVAPAIAVVRVEDENSLGRIVIIRGEGQREELRLPAGSGLKKLGDFGEGMQRIITKLYQEGYSLKSTFEGGRGSRATLIFEKRSS